MRMRSCLLKPPMCWPSDLAGICFRSHQEATKNCSTYAETSCALGIIIVWETDVPTWPLYHLYRKQRGPTPPPLLAAQEGRSCSTHTELEGANQGSHGLKKETKRARERNMQREVRSRKERTRGILGIWVFKVFVLRLHWELNSPNSPKCFLLAAPQKEKLAFSNTETE